MEGYTNVIGSQYDFDDLDIEGRVVDEWNVEDESKINDRRGNNKLINESTILNARVKLDNGQQGDVFSVSRKKDCVWYTCYVCTDTILGITALRQHITLAKHRSNMNKPVHPSAKFIKIDPNEKISLEPGEPVPPGLEEMIIKNCIIQPKLDAYKTPLIGLEFLMELTESPTKDPEWYYCLLCDKTGNDRNMVIHLTSTFHYMKYLSLYFPTVARTLQSLPNKRVKKAFSLLVTEIVGDIEEKYGRLKPRSETYAQFHSQGRKNELQQSAYEGPHFRELDGEAFVEKATPEELDKKAKEVLAAQMTTGQNPDESDKAGDNDPNTITFNKNTRINVDKKQLRTRDDDKLNNSPDIQIVDIALPKSPAPVKKRSRSKSITSLSSISSTSSFSKSKDHYVSHSSHRSKRRSRSRNHRNWSRSHSRSPVSRYHRRRSTSYSRRHSPRRSPSRKWRDSNHSRRDSRGRSRSPHRPKVDRYGREIRIRHDSRGDRNRRDKTSYDKDLHKEVSSTEEKIRWEKFREELKKVESVKLEKLKFHEKNPEKHPQYPEEWKAFWNRRYNELQRSGVDPSKHDFKPEWIAFWTKRMKELYEEELGKAKDELKNKFDLPEDPSATLDKHMPWKHHQRKQSSPGLVDVSPPTPEKKDVIADIKTTWKAFTGSDIKEGPKRPLSPWEEDTSPSVKRESRRDRYSRSKSPSPLPNLDEKLLEDMPQRKSRTSALIFVLRKFTVLEPELGSLAGKVFELLSQSLHLEKFQDEASLDLLHEEENCVFLETAREKLIALLCAGVVPRNKVNTARSAIKNTDIALYLASKRPRVLPVETVRAVMGGQALPAPPTQTITPVMCTFTQPKSEPVVVPGVGQVDKAAIAQQIATALIEQGKTNVTEGELEQLINAVVGMAEASMNSAQPITTANFLSQIQAMQNQASSGLPGNFIAAPKVNVPLATLSNTRTQEGLYNQVSSNSTASMIGSGVEIKADTLVRTDSEAVVTNSQSAAFGALKLLQSAYNDASKPEKDSPKPDAPITSSISDTELAATLSLFNQTNKDEQPNFIYMLKKNNIEMYKRLCPFIPTNVITAADNIKPSSETVTTKRSPISISISKEKSEPKIKPLASGRLSPFSQRSGGVNPTVGEKVVIDDDDDDKNDVKFISETPAKSSGNQGQTRYQNDSEVDDDDDDDYSFEDVYRAAQEKLRQKQLIEDEKSNQSTSTRDTVNTYPSLPTNAEEGSSFKNEKLNIPTSGSNWNIGDLEKSVLPSNENHQQQRLINNQDLQQSQNPNVVSLNPENSSNKIRHDSVQPTDALYQYREGIETDPSHLKPDSTYNDKSGHYSSNSIYSTNRESGENLLREPYPQLQKDSYTSSQRDTYPPSERDLYSTTQRDPYHPSQRDLYTSSQRDPYLLSQRDQYHASEKDPYLSTLRDTYPPPQRETFPPTQRDTYPPFQRDSYPSTQRDPYPATQRDSYPPTQRDPYSSYSRDPYLPPQRAQYSAPYGKESAAFPDHYQYRGNAYASDNYLAARSAQPNYSIPQQPGPPSKYPNPRYPLY